MMFLSVEGRAVVKPNSWLGSYVPWPAFECGQVNFAKIAK